MNLNESRKHHYAPQFFLRNFAVDEGRKRLTAVVKNGHLAIWAKKSIQNLGYERDLYINPESSTPVSVESIINNRFEISISRSGTWLKISSDRADALDQSDKPVIYALIRHLNSRTPHNLSTMNELIEMASNPNSVIPFTDEERAMYSKF